MEYRNLMIAALTALLLVGCGGDDDDSGGGDGGTGGKGAVEGYVVLQGQTDHSGADVTLDGTDQDAVTSETGLYGFADVPAGTYTVTASLAGYTEVTSAPFEVIGGQTVSKSFSGIVEYVPAMLGQKGILAAAIIVALPIAPLIIIHFLVPLRESPQDTAAHAD